MDPDRQSGPANMSALNDCVLVVEDEFIIAEYFVIALEEMGRTVCGVADTAQKAIDLAREHRPCLVLMDVRLKGAADGVHAAIAVQRDVGSKVIFVTGSKEPANLRRMEEGHAAAVLFKPLRGEELQAAIESVMAS
jgi:two-component system, response regulator PdtaR